MECPCCFQELPKTDRARVSLENNVLIWSGIYAQFNPKEAEMLHVLASKYPGWASCDHLLTQMYGSMGGGPDSGDRILWVLATKIRTKLKDADVPITIEGSFRIHQGRRKYRLRYL